MKIYLAAPYAARPIVSEYADELTRIGFTVTSRWLAETHEINPGTTGAATALADAEVGGHALDDLTDVADSRLLVAFTGAAVGIEKAGSGGRHIETGYFIAKRGTLHVIVVGEPENIFHRMAGITRVSNWHEALIELSARLVDNHRPTPVLG